MSPLDALVAEVGREPLWAALSAAYLRTGQTAETAAELLAELNRGGDPVVVEAVKRHPRGAVDAAVRVLIAWARKSPAGRGR